MLSRARPPAMRYLVPAAAIVAVALATEVMLPLYVYPGNATYTTPDWAAAVDAIRDNPDTHFYVVINPNNGPKNTSDPSGNNDGYCNVAGDPNYIDHGCNRDWTTHLAAINKLDNAQTIGYVYTRTGYGETNKTRNTTAIKQDILEWSLWDTAPTWDEGETANISIHGIWFDEVSPSESSAAEMLDLASYANSTFGARNSSGQGPYSVIMNPGVNPDRDYEATLFGMASAVVTRETCFTSETNGDCPGTYTPFNYTDLAPGNGLPYDTALMAQTVVIVHEFRGPPVATNATLRRQIQGVVGLGIHSTYFTGGNWHETTVAPATIGTVADMLTQANMENGASRAGSGIYYGFFAILAGLAVAPYRALGVY